MSAVRRFWDVLLWIDHKSGPYARTETGAHVRWRDGDTVVSVVTELAESRGWRLEHITGVECNLVEIS